MRRPKHTGADSRPACRGGILHRLRHKMHALRSTLHPTKSEPLPICGFAILKSCCPSYAVTRSDWKRSGTHAVPGPGTVPELDNLYGCNHLNFLQITAPSTPASHRLLMNDNYRLPFLPSANRYSAISQLRAEMHRHQRCEFPIFFSWTGVSCLEPASKRKLLRSFALLST